MYYFVISGSGSFHNGFAHCRVRMYRFNQLMCGDFCFTGQYQFCYHFRYIGTDHMGTQ